MCGISLAVKKNNDLNLEVIVNEMNDKILHRGPDGGSVWTNEKVGIGHRRLSIIDLSEAGAQPMSYMNRYKIVYNGEIYNYIELKEELKNLGYSFSNQTDTEVIMAAYHEWKEKAVNRFNGMWAFVLYDTQEEVLFCSRDRFGIKPFYYYENEKGLFAGSELRQLIDFLPSKKANLQVLLDFIVLDYMEHNEFTFFKDIKKLQPGHNLIYNLTKQSYTIKKYYTLKVNPSYTQLSEEEVKRTFQQLMKNSVHLRLRSDVTVGSCLSGGIDSSLITSLAANDYHQQNEDERFIALTARSSQKSNDETPYAKLVVDTLGLNWQLMDLDEEDFLQKIDNVITTQEEPFRSPSIFMQYDIMCQSKKIGCKVLLDGQGGDETFLGYERYYISYLKNLNLTQQLVEVKNIVKHSKLTHKSLVSYFAYFNFAFLRKWNLKRKFSFLQKNFLKQVNWSIIHEQNRNLRHTHKMQTGEIMKYNIPELLRYEDKNSMSQSIETRVPFLDYRLVEFAISISPKFKIQEGWTKYLLRELLSGLLPREISWRTHKVGFEPPNEVWLNNKPFFEEEIKQSKILNHLIKDQNIFSAQTDNMTWKLFNIARWEKLFNVEI